MPLRRRALLVGLCGVLASAGTAGFRGARVEPGAPVEYHLDLSQAEHRVLRVEVLFRSVTGPLVVRMSRTSPGRYAVHDFGKNVSGMRAEDERGAPLELRAVSPHEWHAPGHGGTVRLSYDVFGDRLDGTYLAIDTTHAHVNAPAALAWARGLEDRPVRLRISPPRGASWRVATQLAPTDDPFTFTAPNLGYLMDSPLEVSAFTRRAFTAPSLPGPAASAPTPTIVLALHHVGSERDADALRDDLRRIVGEAGAVFGEYPPFESGRYTFIADYLPWASGDGMEHRDSTVVTSSATLESSRQLLVETAAHEFFHAWNVERIRPRSLEPFDLERPMASPDLWLAEGVTSYYGALLMARAGLTTVAQFVAAMQQDLDVVLSSPARAVRSAEDMSLMAPLVDGAQPMDRTDWSHSFISYYTQGSVIGLGLDLSIRARTGGTRSLDDFMRAMWRRHGAPGGVRPGSVDAPYTIEDVKARLGEVLGDRQTADDWIGRYVQGRETMDYGELLARAGILVQPSRPGRASLGRIALERRGERLRLGAPPPPGSPAWHAGLAQDDEILAIDGQAIAEYDDLERTLQRATPGDEITLRFQRRGVAAPVDRTVRLAQDPGLALALVESAGGRLTPAARAFREAWLGRRQ